MIFLPVLILLLSSVFQVKGQGCPANQSTTDSQNNCYIFNSTALPWQQADDYCKNQYNGALAQTLTTEQLDLLSNLTQQNAAEVWLGLREYYTGWSWSDASNTGSFSVWYSESDSIHYGQPDTCAAINLDKNFLWTKESCAAESEFMCEVPTSSVHCVDQIADRIRVLVSNRCFLLVQNVFQSWFDSEVYCQSLGGQLASVNTQQVHEAVTSPLSPSNWRRFWIGLRQSQHYWSTGSLTSTYFWGTRQPRGTGDCVKLYYDRTDGVYNWHSDVCNTSKPFVCQTGTATATRTAITTVIVPITTTTTTTTPAYNLEGTPPINTTQPQVNIAGQNDGPNPATTAGLAVLIIVIFAILVGLIVFFWYFTKRNRRLRKEGREQALTAENVKHQVRQAEFINSEFSNGDVDDPVSMFTTSFTGTGNFSNHQRAYMAQPVMVSKQPLQQPLNSRCNSTTSLHSVDKHAPSPVDRPDTDLSASYSKRSLKTDSEGTSETDDSSSVVGGTKRKQRNMNHMMTTESQVRLSKRKELGERGTKVRRSKSKVAPQRDVTDVTQYNHTETQDYASSLNSTSSFRQKPNHSHTSETRPDESHPQPKPRKHRYQKHRQSPVNAEHVEMNEMLSDRSDARTEVTRNNLSDYHTAKPQYDASPRAGKEKYETTPRDELGRRGSNSSRRQRMKTKTQDPRTYENGLQNTQDNVMAKGSRGNRYLEQGEHVLSGSRDKEHVLGDVGTGAKRNKYLGQGEYVLGDTADRDHAVSDHAGSSEGEGEEFEHEQTLYLQTCNTMDDLSDIDDAESLPDDQKLDIFV